MSRKKVLLVVVRHSRVYRCNPHAAVRYAKKAGFSETVALEACLQDQLRKSNIKKRVRIEDAA